MAAKEPSSRDSKSRLIPTDIPIIGESVKNILKQAVQLVDSSLDKTYSETLEIMTKLDYTLFSVAELQKDLGFLRNKLSKQASTLRRPQPLYKPAEGDVRPGTNGKSYIFLGGAWGNYLDNTPSSPNL